MERWRGSKLVVADAASNRAGKLAESSETRQDIEVSFGAAKVRDFAVSYCASPSGGIRADVRVSGREVARLKRLARDATLVVVGCSSAAAGACTEDLRDRAKALAESSGLAVGEAVLVNGEPAVDDLRARAFSAGAAKTLVLRLDAPTLLAEDCYRVCRAQGAATLMDMEDLKVLHTAKPKGFGVDGGFKGVVYADKGSDRDACSKAFRETFDAVKAMTDRWAASAAP